ncbi:hypothetical protein FALCPG4_009186 [Fusarium falciforme]
MTDGGSDSLGVGGSWLLADGGFFGGQISSSSSCWSSSSSLPPSFFRCLQPLKPPPVSKLVMVRFRFRSFVAANICRSTHTFTHHTTFICLPRVSVPTIDLRLRAG